MIRRQKVQIPDATIREEKLPSIKCTLVQFGMIRCMIVWVFPTNQQCNTADDAAALRGDALPFLALSFALRCPRLATHPFTSNACEVIVTLWWESRQSSLAVRFLRDELEKGMRGMYGKGKSRDKSQDIQTSLPHTFDLPSFTDCADN